MWGITVPKTTKSETLERGAQLPLAFELSSSEKSAATKKRRAKRQPPLRTCGQCSGSFRSWKKDALCGKCEEDGSARPRSSAAPSAVELGGPEDDGSFHFLATGEPEPKS